MGRSIDEYRQVLKECEVCPEGIEHCASVCEETESALKGLMAALRQHQIAEEDTRHSLS